MVTHVPCGAPTGGFQSQVKPAKLLRHGYLFHHHRIGNRVHETNNRALWRLSVLYTWFDEINLYCTTTGEYFADLLIKSQRGLKDEKQWVNVDGGLSFITTAVHALLSPSYCLGAATGLRDPLHKIGSLWCVQEPPLRISRVLGLCALILPSLLCSKTYRSLLLFTHSFSYSIIRHASLGGCFTDISSARSSSVTNSST
jgi:hypothetical protein